MAAAPLPATLELIAAWHTPGGPTPSEPNPLREARGHEYLLEAARELRRLSVVPALLTALQEIACMTEGTTAGRTARAALAKALATCPKCNGTKRMPAGDEWARSYGYDAATKTTVCRNCGGQSMSLTATGMTRVDPATGLGCLHEYRGQEAGNCYRVYTCAKCGDRYDIDSSD